MRFIWKWFKRIITGMAALIILAVIIGTVRSTPMPTHAFTASDEVLVIAHRGGRGLWPENTLLAFEESVKIGVDVLEFDVHATRDSVLVVMHDATVDRTTEGTGRISDLTWAEISSLDAGYDWTPDGGATFPYRGQGLRIPAFTEVLMAFPDEKMNIELKSDEDYIRSNFLSLIESHHPPEKTVIASFRSEIITYVRENSPEIATAATVGDAFAFWILNALYLGFSYSPEAQVFQVPPGISGLNVVTPAFVTGAHAHNVDVHVWTINDEDKMAELIDFGVDGIMTDYPDRLLRVLGRRIGSGQIDSTATNYE